MTLIEFYDKDVLKNILAGLSLRPDKIIFLYDSELKDMNVFISLQSCFKKHIPHIVFERYAVDIDDIDSMYSVITKLLLQEEDAAINLTGGSELMIISGYKAGVDCNARILYTNIIHGTVTNLGDKSESWRIPKLSLSDFMDAKGVGLKGSSHIAPRPEQFETVKEMCRIIFEDTKSWKELCSFIQSSMAHSRPDELYLKNKNPFVKRGTRVPRLLSDFWRLGFITEPNYGKSTLSFEFKNVNFKNYMINYGVWMELFVYITAIETKKFDDVLLGLMLDWDIFDRALSVDNEIDVVISDNSVPVFVSCKLTEANTAALNELVLNQKRMGGWFSKGVIVTFGKERTLNTGTYQRAKDLGLELLDKNDVLAPDFGARLVRAIKNHDLVSMKWTKIS